MGCVISNAKDIKLNKKYNFNKYKMLLAIKIQWLTAFFYMIGKFYFSII